MRVRLCLQRGVLRPAEGVPFLVHAVQLHREWFSHEQAVAGRHWEKHAEAGTTRGAILPGVPPPGKTRQVAWELRSDILSNWILPKSAEDLQSNFNVFLTCGIFGFF